MPAGELNLQLSTPSPQAQPPASEDRDLPPLPDALQAPGKALVKALKEDAQVAQAFATFCSAAYVKPDWAGAASEFLAELFSEHEDLLAELARIPDLIIELASGHITLTCMVAARWAARGETHRLARLAEALITTQSKMCGTSAVIEIMLALATSLAITRYSRAEQLLNAAEPQATEDQQEALMEARLWLAAGRIVRGCSQEVRDLWDQRLRRSRQAWSWESQDEREALLQLADHMQEGLEGFSLFEAVVPTAWLDVATLRAKEQAEPDPAPPQPVPIPQLRLPASFPQEHERDHVQPWIALPFIAGSLMGALSVTGALWLTQPKWLMKPHGLVSSPAAITKNVTDSTRPDAPKGPGNASNSEAKLNLIPPTNEELDKGPPAPTEATASTSNMHPNAQWRAERLSSLSKEEIGLAPLVEAVKRGTWADNESLLKGDSSDAPRMLPSYQKLLLWLHLDPPTDPDVRSKIPGLLVGLRADQPVLDLWKKLVYEGSPNAGDIRNAAKQQVHGNADAWTEAQRNELMEIAGWGVASAAP